MGIGVTPAGFFDGSEDGAWNLKLVRGLDPLPFEGIAPALHRPGLVAEAMPRRSGGRVRGRRGGT